MPFGEPWASVHCGLRSARADRHPSSSWVAPLGRFSSGRLRLVVLVVPQRTQLTLLDIYPASNAPKVPYWAKLGDFWRGIIPFQGGQTGLLQKLGSVTRVMCNSRVCPAKVSTIRIFPANKRQIFSSETHFTVDASIHIRPSLKDNIFGNVPWRGCEPHHFCIGNCFHILFFHFIWTISIWFSEQIGIPRHPMFKKGEISNHS